MMALKEFLGEECLVRPGDNSLYLEAAKLREAYLQFCLKQCLDESQFGEALKALGVTHKQKGGKKHRCYYYIGIKLKGDLLKGLERSAKLEDMAAAFTKPITFQTVPKDGVSVNMTRNRPFHTGRMTGRESG